MRLIHHFKPLLELGSCKEYCMAARNSGSTSRRTKKAAVQAPVAQPVEIPQTPSNGNLEDLIRQRAYEIYLERGSSPGNESEDWLVAEREVLTRSAAAGHSA